MFYKLCKWIAKLLVSIKFRIEVNGIEFFPGSGPVIVAANHGSGYDPIILGTIIKRNIHFLAKKELFSCFASRWFLSKLHGIPVDRSSGNAIRPVRCCLRLLNHGEVLGIFPEGKRCKPGEIVQPKKGVAYFAVKTGAPIVPVALVGVAKGFRKPVKVSIGTPIDPVQFGVTDYSQISQLIMKQIRNMTANL